MIAFVLSGGGNLGAMQIGALEALMRKGIRPELLVGTSAGAVNAAYLATNPTLEGVKQLAQIWKHMKKDNIYPGGPLRMAWHLAIHQTSLCPGRTLSPSCNVAPQEASAAFMISRSLCTSSPQICSRVVVTCLVRILMSMLSMQSWLAQLFPPIPAMVLSRLIAGGRWCFG